MPQVSVSLPEGLIDMIEEKVKSGRYSSQSEVVREALRRFSSNDEDVQVAQFNAYMSSLMNYRKEDLSNTTIPDIIKRKNAQHQKR